MAHRCHVSEAAEWLDGAVSGKVSSKTGGKEDEEEGVKVGRKV